MGKIIKGVFQTASTSGNVCAIIPAAGKGERMGLGFNKMFLSIDDKPVISYTLDVFENSSLVSEIIIVASEEDIPLISEIVEDFGYQKVKTIVRGGKTRQESVQNALIHVSENIKTVAIHDGARCMLPPSILQKVLVKGLETGAAAVGIMAKDTVKLIENETIKNTLDRSKIALIQTPQVFEKELLLSAYQKANEEGSLVTDDCALVEKTGKQIAFVEGSALNMKLTTPDDYLLISSYITMRGEI